MSDEHDTPARQFRAGLGLLARAAFGAVSNLRRDARSAKAKGEEGAGALGQALNDAGREVARAAGNVASTLSRIATGEPAQGASRPGGEPPANAPDASAPAGSDEGAAGSAGASKPRGPTEDDPGFTILK
jgi:hypothetical protein